MNGTTATISGHDVVSTGRPSARRTARPPTPSPAAGRGGRRAARAGRAGEDRQRGRADGERRHAQPQAEATDEHRNTNVLSARAPVRASALAKKKARSGGSCRSRSSISAALSRAALRRPVLVRHAVAHDQQREERDRRGDERRRDQERRGLPDRTATARRRAAPVRPDARQTACVLCAGRRPRRGRGPDRNARSRLVGDEVSAKNTRNRQRQRRQRVHESSAASAAVTTAPRRSRTAAARPRASAAGPTTRRSGRQQDRADPFPPMTTADRRRRSVNRRATVGAYVETTVIASGEAERRQPEDGEAMALAARERAAARRGGHPGRHAKWGTRSAGVFAFA